VPRRLLKRLIPDPHTLRERWFLRPFGARITNPLLWTLHRRGVTPAFGAGLAICFVPLPVHLILATSVAVIWRLNIPVICGTTLLLNPFTAVPARSEEHTSELQSQSNLVCRLLLEKT